MTKENLAIICNEKTHFYNENYFCDNIDLKSIPEGLNENFDVKLFLRKSKIERSSHTIDLKNISISNGIISYIFKVIKKINSFEKCLVISLSPYTFFTCLFLFLFRKKVFLYLRSDGYEEYKCYSKYLGPFFYHIMFNIVSWGANLIACRSHILKGKKGSVVSPSQLNQKWFTNRREANLKKINLLYVGRIKIEKGILSLLDIMKKISLSFNISIINSEKNYDKNLESKNVKIIYFQNKDDSIINIYDDHNIFILPSFTEGHPQVLDESLSRLRPVIIFPEISHVKRNREGIFVSQRDVESLSDKIEYIIKNYESVQKRMIKNKLPTKISFLKELTSILKN